MSSPAHAFPDDLAQDLAAGVMLLTVNKRLARHLRDGYDRHRAAAGSTAWDSPQILPFNAWLQRCHAELVELGLISARLPDASQERVLWERAIASGNDTLMRPAAAARSAADAYRLLHDWQLSGHAQLALSPEGEAFARWSETFERLCEQHQLLPAARLAARIAEAVQQGQLDAPPRLWLAGFDEQPPAQQALLATLAASGTALRTLADPAPTTTPLRLQCTDLAEERQLAASWALTRLRANPAARLAIITPDTAGQREPLRQLLIDTLAPDSLAPGAADAPLPFNFSLGRPLAEQPLVRDALLALSLSQTRIEHGELAQLLRSPFIAAGVAEQQPRTLFDAELRRRGLPRYDLYRLRQEARRPAPDSPYHCPLLFARLEQVAAALADQPRKAAASHWAKQFQALLAAWGWPGERPLNSHEYQQSQAFNDLLGQLARLDRVTGDTAPRLALARLQQLARDTVFQSEGSDAPLQVLGVLEAAGQQFDHLWLLGLDDNHWPPPPAPNPLLPAALQRSAGLPHGSAERELRFARQVTARLSAAAPEVVVSHARRHADGEQGPSPLIEKLPVGEVTELGLSPGATPPAAARLTPLHDWQAPPAPAMLGGGTPLLGDQAACPFRAFARHRLTARGLESVRHGTDPRLVGNMVHQALHDVWQRLGDQQTLLTTPAEALDALIEESVQAAVEAYGRERPDLYLGPFRTLEQARLVELIADWLQRERQRAPFEVLRLEQRDQARIGPLTLQVQADRVDALGDGRTVVIDYKTGRGQRTGTWTRPRPEEPQVPLYAIQQGERLAAAAIARVRMDRDAGFKGLAEDDGVLPGIKAFRGADTIRDWAALGQHWRQQLAALAEEVAGGRADPTPSAQACAYCELAPLCRVALLDLNGDDHGEAGDD